MAADAILSIRGLVRRFGGVAAVNGVDLDVWRGETLAIIGPNGAGKTTFYNLISGRMTPSTGSIRFNGREIGGMAPQVIQRLGIGRSFQINNLFTEMSVRQNVEVAVTAHLGQSWRWWDRASANAAVRQRADALLAQLQIAPLAAQRADTISYGDKRLVEIAMVLAGEPTLILLDEPTAGMTPTETNRVIALVRGLAESGAYTFLITEHDMKVVFGVADRILVLHHGQKLVLDTPAAVRVNSEVRRAYLGDASEALEGVA